MMKSIDRLRDANVLLTWENGTLRANELADEIEREIAERYMELPLDADGVPIHVGDVVRINGLSGTLPVDGIGCERVWFMHNGNAGFTTVMNVHHFKPRTVEDVLMSAGVSVAIIEDVASELRELMGVDA